MNYLCEEDIYSPENYDIIKEKYKDTIDECRYSWMLAALQLNEDAFKAAFNMLLEKMSYKWIESRMIVHTTLTHSSEDITDEEFEVFSKCDDWMIDILHQHPLLNR
jgi:hypothetical protein